MKNKKYKLTLLKDLPNYKAGAELVDITENILSGKTPYLGIGKEIFQLKDNPTWVKIEEDNRCICTYHSKYTIFHKIISYGRETRTSLDFNNKRISVWYDYKADCGDSYTTEMNYCPICGRKL